MIYLSPTYYSIIDKYKDKFGYIFSNDTSHWIAVEMGYPFFLDNGVYVGKFEHYKWLDAVELASRSSENCIGIAAPDVLYNKDATLYVYEDYAHLIKSYGLKSFLVTQDGMKVKDIPWDIVDGIFIGGSDDHKLHDSWDLIREAKRIGLWVHVGRVNSPSRMRKFACVDSVDGTTLIREPSVRNQQKIVRAMSEIQGMKEKQLCFTF